MYQVSTGRGDVVGRLSFFGQSDDPFDHEERTHKFLGRCIPVYGIIKGDGGGPSEKQTSHAYCMESL